MLATLDELAAAGKISLEAITYMRGRSIPYQYILIDEVQNLNPHEVKTLVSRVGEGSKIILAGDPFQIDSPYLDVHSNGLVVTNEKFKGQPLFGCVFLETSERSELSKLATELL
jgi:PhoH-like ATPase